MELLFFELRIDECFITRKDNIFCNKFNSGYRSYSVSICLFSRMINKDPLVEVCVAEDIGAVN